MVNSMMLIGPTPDLGARAAGYRPGELGPVHQALLCVDLSTPAQRLHDVGAHLFLGGHVPRQLGQAGEVVAYETSDAAPYECSSPPSEAARRHENIVRELDV